MHIAELCGIVLLKRICLTRIIGSVAYRDATKTANKELHSTRSVPSIRQSGSSVIRWLAGAIKKAA